MTAVRNAVGLLRRMVVFEIRLWGNLGRWILRRPRVEPGATAYGYARAITPLIVVLVAVSAIEIPIAHLIVPWETVRLVVDLLGLYGLMWMVGMLATLRVNPHLASPDGLRVRGEGGLDLTVPWDFIETADVNHRMVRGRRVGIDASDGRPMLHIAVMNQTNVDIVLRDPTIVELPRRDTEPVRGLRIAADEPERLVAAVRERLAHARITPAVA
jgi:hypothetical protein